MTDFGRSEFMDDDWLAGRFEGNRVRLRAMAYRMLGSASDAEDAVQEAWIRASSASADEVANLDGWFTTIVARVCLDMLRSRKSRREAPGWDDLDSGAPALARNDEGPEQEALLADAVGLALLMVLDTLAPAERVAFVLHDLFAVTFDEIAAIVERSPAAARQLASRARRRVREAVPVPDADRTRQRTVVDAFLAAAPGGDFQALLALLDPAVVLRADRAAVHLGAAREVRGAPAVAEHFAGRARAA